MRREPLTPRQRLLVVLLGLGAVLGISSGLHRGSDHGPCGTGRWEPPPSAYYAPPPGYYAPPPWPYAAPAYPSR